MDDRVEGGRLILWKIDMGHKREKMGKCERERVDDEKRQ